MSKTEFKPLYTTLDSVKVRLVNKVQFQANPKRFEDGELPDALLGQLIRDAETEVEQDLRGRYAIPFRSIAFGNFDALPDSSKRAIRTACDYRAVILILSTDFGRGTHISGEAYTKSAEKLYAAYIDKLLGRDAEAANAKHDRFRFTPPLQDLMLALSNSKADDGFKGTLVNTDASVHGAETYAAEQINDPAKSYINQRPGPRVV